MKEKQELPPQPPAGLEEPYQELWSRYAYRMGYPGRLITFAQCLYALQRADQARQMVDRQGLTVTTKKTGMKHLNPLLKVEKENRDVAVKLWKQLGLNHEPSPF